MRRILFLLIVFVLLPAAAEAQRASGTVGTSLTVLPAARLEFADGPNASATPVVSGLDGAIVSVTRTRTAAPEPAAAAAISDGGHANPPSADPSPAARPTSTVVERVTWVITPSA